MASTYQLPMRRTGTSEDFMAIIVRAEALRYERQKAVVPHKTTLQRLLLEVPCNIAGLIFSRFLEALPAERLARLHQKVFSGLASPKSYPFDDKSAALESSRELFRRVEKETGKKPAVLALVSHPPVLGDMAHLNFELMRHSLLAMRELGGASCRPRLVVAVDPFALDTASMPLEGIYAGVMGNYHIGIDRMALERGTASRALVRSAAWHRMAYRLFGILRRGGAVGMVLSGGVPQTTRVLYAAKEWLASQRAQSALKSRPSEVLKSLRGKPGFALYGKYAGDARGAWRALEAYLACALTGIMEDGGQEHSAADTGRLNEEAKAGAKDCLEALGFGAKQVQLALELLAEELARETPYRARFFRLLAGRVLKSGTPLVIVPVAHRIEGGLGVEIKPAWAWLGMQEGVVRAREAGAKGPDWQGSPEAFAVRFVRENFS